MVGKKKGLCILVIMILILALGGTVLVFARKYKKEECKLIQGENYLKSLEYDDAIDTFEIIINDRPKCVEAYLGTIKAYESEGKDDFALAVARKGYWITEDRRVKDWIFFLKEKTKRESKQNLVKKQFGEDKSDEGYALTSGEEKNIRIKELFECPSVGTVSWCDAGGADEMLKMLADNANSSYMEDSADNKHIGIYYNSEAIFGYGEECNGSVKYVRAQYTIGDDMSEDSTGLYEYLSKYGFGIDEIVSNMGVDVEKLKSSKKLEYMSDMGTATIEYDSESLYYFEILGDNAWAIVLAEGEELGHTDIILRINPL